MINSYNNLTRVENEYKTSQIQENLILLMMLLSENDILQPIDFNETLQ